MKLSSPGHETARLYRTYTTTRLVFIYRPTCLCPVSTVWSFFFEIAWTCMQWRIQDFPECGGGGGREGGTSLLFDQFFEIAWTWRNFGPGGTRLVRAQIHHWYHHDHNILYVLPQSYCPSHCYQPTSVLDLVLMSKNCHFWRVLVFLWDLQETCFRSLLLYFKSWMKVAWVVHYLHTMTSSNSSLSATPAEFLAVAVLFSNADHFLFLHLICIVLFCKRLFNVSPAIASSTFVCVR